MIYFHYFGQPCELTLCQISGESIPKKHEQTSVGDVTEHLQSMQLDTQQAETSESHKQLHQNKSFFKMQCTTRVIIQSESSVNMKLDKHIVPGISDVGGLQSQIKMLQELVDLQLKKPHHIQKHGIKVLLFLCIFLKIQKNYYQLFYFSCMATIEVVIMYDQIVKGTIIKT